VASRLEIVSEMAAKCCNMEDCSKEIPVSSGVFGVRLRARLESQLTAASDPPHRGSAP
jgi:hypothetical protein